MTGESPAFSYSLRPARPAELRRLQQIERAAAQLFPSGRVDPNATLSESALTDLLRSRWLFCLAAEGTADLGSATDLPVGFVAATVQTDQLYIEELSVHPAHAQRGLGSRLLKFCIARARQHRHRLITLTTFADLPWNAPFYRRFGFTGCNEGTIPPFLDAQLRAERAAGLEQRIAMQLRL